MKLALLLALLWNADAFTTNRPSQPMPWRQTEVSTSRPLFSLRDPSESRDESRRSMLTKIAGGIGSLLLSSSSSPLPAMAATAKAQSVVPTPAFPKELSWPLGKVAFSLLPLAGTATRRATIQEEIVPGTIWTHDQVQGIVNVNVPVRQTVIKLSPDSGGGLWVYNPVAPTPQLLAMMKELEAKHGPVRHIVLGSVAVEHKATFGPFARQFPKATVWIQPGQWAFPLSLPIDALGVTQKGPRLREIPVPGKPVTSDLYQAYADEPPEWLNDLDYEVLGPLKFKSVGAYAETAFFHKSTKSLIVTDSVVSVTPDPPAIIAEDPRGLLFHARDSINDLVQDTPETRRKGWRRMVQFGLVFFPAQIDILSAGEALSEASNIRPELRNLGDGAVPGGALYPWVWHEGDADQRNFDAISKQGKLFCPPILTKLIMDREPQRTLDWVDSIATRFDFKRVIPAHLANNVQATPTEFREAFVMLESTAENPKPQRPLAEDLALLQKVSDVFTDLGIVAPSQVCDSEPARRTGRFAS